MTLRATLTLALAVALCQPMLAWPAPYLPSSDAQVLERAPTRADSPRQRDMASLRRELNATPNDAALAVRLVEHYLVELFAEGDPRYLGYAQAALAPWWKLADPPAEVRVKRAVLLQFNHQFAPALVDLQAAAQTRADDAEAWAWIAAIHMVQAHYDAARQACQRLVTLSSELIGIACVAQVDGTTGHAAVAIAALRKGLREQTDASAEERLWALTRLAEAQERVGDTPGAEAGYREALGLGLEDSYLRAAHADFLLDQGRAAEVLTALKDKSRTDVLLLRLAIAAKATKDASLPRHSAALSARFDAARLRGDTAHRKEEARFALQVLGDAARALPLAQANFEEQREPADARLLLEAALAARRTDAAAPALAWLRASGIESPRLRALAASLEALK